MSDKSTWEKYFSVSDVEWKKIVEKAIEVWDNLDDVEKNSESFYETDNCPMHPSLFFQLSNVRGFNKLNGYTYSKYVENWKDRKYNNE